MPVQLNASQIKDLIRHYTEEKSKLEFQLQNTDELINKLETSLKGVDTTTPVEVATPPKVEAAPKKRGRGRPPKAKVEATAPATTTKKRGRGRPPKVETEAKVKTEVTTEKKRGRGRPPKAKVEAAAPATTTKKRGRGRPPKVEAQAKVKTEVTTEKKRGRGRPPKAKVEVAAPVPVATKAVAKPAATTKPKKKKSIGKRGRPAGSIGKLSEWDEVIVKGLRRKGKVLPNPDLLELFRKKNKKDEIPQTDIELKGRLNRSLQKLANKNGKLVKIPHEGKGFSYGLSIWLDKETGEIQAKYQQES